MAIENWLDFFLFVLFWHFIHFVTRYQNCNTEAKLRSVNSTSRFNFSVIPCGFTEGAEAFTAPTCSKGETTLIKHIHLYSALHFVLVAVAVVCSSPYFAKAN